MIRLQSSRPTVGVVHEDKRSSRRCSCSAGLAESNEHWKAELAFPIGVIRAHPCLRFCPFLRFAGMHWPEDPGKFDQARKPNRSIKGIYGYPLVRKFRERLCYE